MTLITSKSGLGWENSKNTKKKSGPKFYPVGYSVTMEPVCYLYEFIYKF